MFFLLCITAIVSSPVTLALFFDNLRAEVPKVDCNIILITIDTLRADHLSCYGYHRNTTPIIDKIAKEGIGIRILAPADCQMPSVTVFLFCYYICSIIFSKEK